MCVWYVSIYVYMIFIYSYNSIINYTHHTLNRIMRELHFLFRVKTLTLDLIQYLVNRNLNHL